MRRLKEYNPDQHYLFSFDPQKAFPVGSYEYFIVDLVRRIVDEKGFYPEKVGYTTPDHSTISRFVGNFTKKIITLFAKLLYIAAEEGFIDYKLTATDGTKIRANASDKFSSTVEDFKKRKGRLEAKITEALEKSKQADEEEVKNYWNKKIERHEKLKNKIESFLTDLEEVTKKNGKEVKQNITDNCARTMKIEGKGYKPAYNAQATVCGKNGFIVGPGITVDNAVYATEKGLDTYIAPGTTKELYGNETGERESETIGIKNCRIEKNGTEVKITCPGGLELTKCTKIKIRDESYYHFAVHDLDSCKLCPFFGKCYGKIKEGNKKGFRIKLELLDNWELV